jgi:small GTP-binding protein
MTISKKVILTGSFGVGKTSLFNQFIHSIFDNKYLTTIGVKVSKKTIVIDDRELSMIIWDIAGEVTQDKVPLSYFMGAEGIVYVFDLTRASTIKNLPTDLEYLKKILPNGIIRIVGNKKDLLDDEQTTAFLTEHHLQPDLLTSAKTGENVEKLFADLGAAMLQ